MSPGRSSCLLPSSVLTLVLAFAGRANPSSTVPAGAQLHVRLTTALSTATAKKGQAVKALIIEPLLSGDQIAIPSGAQVDGVIGDVLAADAAG